jgi:hypothetical protein
VPSRFRNPSNGYEENVGRAWLLFAILANDFSGHSRGARCLFLSILDGGSFARCPEIDLQVSSFLDDVELRRRRVPANVVNEVSHAS